MKNGGIKQVDGVSVGKAKLPPITSYNAPRMSLASQLEQEAKVVAVAQLAIQGLTQVEISKKIGVSKVNVEQMLAEARKQWLAASIVAYDEMKARELARVNEVERQQWIELEALNQEDDSERRKQWWTTRQKNAYNRIMWCVEQRCKLFGLYAPQEVINWKAEAAQAGYDPDMIYRILVHEMSNIVTGNGKVVDASPAMLLTDGTGDQDASGDDL